jgi:hypothetical protein
MDSGIARLTSHRAVAETIDRLEALLEERGVMVHHPAPWALRRSPRTWPRWCRSSSAPRATEGALLRGLYFGV